MTRQPTKTIFAVFQIIASSGPSGHCFCTSAPLCEALAVSSLLLPPASCSNVASRYFCCSRQLVASGFQHCLADTFFPYICSRLLYFRIYVSVTHVTGRWLFNLKLSPPLTTLTLSTVLFLDTQIVLFPPLLSMSCHSTG